MAFDARHFVDVANYLLTADSVFDREALQRTGIGRLYYGLFLQMRAYLRTRGVRAATLGAVVIALEGVPELAELSGDFRRLHALRNRCDYDDSNDLRVEEIARARRLARRIEATMASRW